MIHLLGLFVMAALAAPRLPIDVLPGYPLGLDDFLWAALVLLAFPRLLRSSLVVPAFAWLTVLALSIACGFALSTYASGAGAFLSLAKSVQLVSVAFIARAVVSDAADLKTLVRWAAAGVALLGVVGLADAVIHADEIRMPGPLPFRIFDNAFYLGQTNHVAGAIAILTPLLLVGGARYSVLLGVAVIFLAGSRGAFLALGEGMLVWLFLERRWKPLGIVAVAFVALFSFGPIAKRLSFRQWEWDTFKSTMERRWAGLPEHHTVTRNRYVTAWTSLDEFRHAPVLGTGLGSRHRVFYESAYVQTVAETGLLGVLAVALLGIAVVRVAYGLSPPWRAAMIACVAAFAVLGIGAVVGLIARVAIPFWAMVGAADGARGEE